MATAPNGAITENGRAAPVHSAGAAGMADGGRGRPLLDRNLPGFDDRRGSGELSKWPFCTFRRPVRLGAATTDRHRVPPPAAGGRLAHRPGRNRHPAAGAMDDPAAPRLPATGPHRHERHERRDRRHPVRLLLYAGGGLFGAGETGWWLAQGDTDGSPLSRIPFHVPRSVAVGAVMGLAGWGALLLLGEVLLFVLAVARVDDPEVHERYRNLIILWGYVLTLGTSRFFRRLPAQFFGDDAETEARHRSSRDGGRRNPSAHG